MKSVVLVAIGLFISPLFCAEQMPEMLDAQTIAQKAAQFAQNIFSHNPVTRDATWSRGGYIPFGLAEIRSEIEEYDRYAKLLYKLVNFALLKVEPEDTESLWISKDNGILSVDSLPWLNKQKKMLCHESFYLELLKECKRGWELPPVHFRPADGQMYTKTLSGSKRENILHTQFLRELLRGLVWSVSPNIKDFESLEIVGSFEAAKKLKKYGFEIVDQEKDHWPSLYE